MRDADKLLAGLIRLNGGWTALLAVAALAAAVAELVLPQLLGAALDSAIAGETAPRLFAGCALVVAVATVGEVAADLAAGTSRVGVTASLRHRLVRHLLGAGPSAPGTPATGDLVARVTASADEAGHAPPAVVLTVTSLVPALGALAALFLIDPVLGGVFLAGSLLTLALLRAFVRDASDVVEAYQRAQGTIAGALLEALGGLRTIAAAGTRRFEVARVLKGLPELRRHGDAMWRTQAKVSVRMSALGPLTEIAVLAAAGLLVFHRQISPGELVAASRYAVLGGALGSVIGLLNRLARARAAAARAADLLSAPRIGYGTRSLPESDPGDDVAGHLALGRIEFHAVRCGPLAELSLTVPSGLSMAVVGEGASTLAALAGRLAEPESGEILLDGVPLAALSRESLRAAVGYAFARPALVGETVHDVIALGPRPAGTDTVHAAARSARADGFVRRLPAGYDTRVEDAPLSGGEAQRLGLARAFAHPGRLLVFDDATSSLDTVTELQVSQAITGELRDRTRLIVAARAATAARADLVAWLDGGRLRALAEHDTLWRDPAYRALFGVVPHPAAMAAGGWHAP